MKRMLLLLVLFFLFTGCSPSAEDLVSNLLDDFELEEGYECHHGDATLPSGSHPDELITPEDYRWKCSGGGADSLWFDADGTFSVALTRAGYAEKLDYLDYCAGSASRQLTGEWVVSGSRLCAKFDNVQSGLYNCRSFSYGSGTIRDSGCVDYYLDGEYAGQECATSERIGSCTLEEE